MGRKPFRLLGIETVVGRRQLGIWKKVTRHDSNILGSIQSYFAKNIKECDHLQADSALHLLVRRFSVTKAHVSCAWRCSRMLYPKCKFSYSSSKIMFTCFLL